MPSSVDRVDFNAQIAVLCAGFNVPATAERLEAYWVGLAKMQMPAVIRVVDHALGQDGPEKIPTASGMWALYRKLKSQARPASANNDRNAPPVVDAYGGFANRALMVFLQKHGAASVASLERLVAEKNRIAEDFRIIAAEETVTADEFREAAFRAFERVFQPCTFDDVEAGREQTCRERGLVFVPRDAPRTLERAA